MSTVIGQDCETAPQRGGTNQEVEVADSPAFRSQPAAFAAQNARDFIVYPEQPDAARKALQRFLAFSRIA
jgi:hypothetical protein